MFNAVVDVHWDKGVWTQNGGFELALLYGIPAVTITLTGPGRLCFDRNRPGASGGALPAAVALGVGLTGGPDRHDRQGPLSARRCRTPSHMECRNEC